MARVQTVVATEEDGSEIQKVVIASVGGAGEFYRSVLRRKSLAMGDRRAAGPDEL